MEEYLKRLKRGDTRTWVFLALLLLAIAFLSSILKLIGFTILLYIGVNYLKEYAKKRKS